MALPPQTDTDDAFVREVDEELRREQIGTFWRRYGRVLVGAVIAGLALFAAWLWWEARQTQAAAADSEALVQALDEMSAGHAAEAEPALTKLAATGSKSYAALARLTLAARMVEKGNASAAAKAYEAITADKAVPQEMRDLALLRATLVRFDTLPPADVVTRLKSLAVEGNPWFGTAGELTAIAQLKLGRADQAEAMFTAVAKDASTPKTIRARAERMADALGAGASTPAPAIAKD